MRGQWSLFNGALVSSLRLIPFPKKENWLSESWSRSPRLQYGAGKQINTLEYISPDLHGHVVLNRHGIGLLSMLSLFIT